MEDKQQIQQPSYPAEIDLRLRDLEEKHRLLKERVLLIGNNLIEKSEQEKAEIRNLKVEITKIKQNLNKVNATLQRVIELLDNFARKEEIISIEKQLDMLNPFKK